MLGLYPLLAPLVGKFHKNNLTMHRKVVADTHKHPKETDR